MALIDEVLVHVFPENNEKVIIRRYFSHVFIFVICIQHLKCPLVCLCSILKGLVKWSITVVSNFFLSVITFATIVATKFLLLPLLSKFERYVVYLQLEILNNCLSPHVAGEWRQGWTTLVYQIRLNTSTENTSSRTRA